MAVFYADASALVKLVREEAESGVLRAYLDGADLVSSELVLTEIPRAVRRAVAQDPALPLDLLLERAGELVDVLALRPLDRALLEGAGRSPSRRCGLSTRSMSRPPSTLIPSRHS